MYFFSITILDNFTILTISFIFENHQLDFQTRKQNEIFLDIICPPYGYKLYITVLSKCLFERRGIYMIRIEEQNLIKNMNLLFFELSKKKPHKRYKEMISLIFCILYVFHMHKLILRYIKCKKKNKMTCKMNLYKYMCSIKYIRISFQKKKKGAFTIRNTCTKSLKNNSLKIMYQLHIHFVKTTTTMSLIYIKFTLKYTDIIRYECVVLKFPLSFMHQMTPFDAACLLYKINEFDFVILFIYFMT